MLTCDLAEGMEYKKELNFVIAASCFKHSIPRDANLFTKDKLIHLMEGEISGCIQK